MTQISTRLTGNFQVQSPDSVSTHSSSGGLAVAGLSLPTFCAQQNNRGPLYLYDLTWIESQYQALDKAFSSAFPHGHQISYAVKANDCLAILHRLAALGAGADIVSSGELDRAVAADIPAEKIVFAGVGKTEAEIEKALIVGIQKFNVESVQELDRIASVAARLGLVAPVALRTNPDVDAQTLAKITTGTKGDKFGIALGDIPALATKIKTMPSLRLDAIAMHIGSQITSLEPYCQAYGIMATLVQTLQAQGTTLKCINVGGGMGVDYGDGATGLNFDDFAAVVAQALGGLGLPVLIEPGRSMVAEAGALLTQVQYVKESYGHRFAIVDAGMHTLIRPALYEASHPIFPVRNPLASDTTATDLVGPICESTDVFAKQIQLPTDLVAGDWLALLSAGAYGHVMASQYNGHDLPPLWVAENGTAQNMRPPLGDVLLAKEIALLPRS